MIPEDKLIEFGATLKKYDKGDRIIREGQKAVFYYQIASGNVKMNNFNESGKEFIQGMFSAAESFGEPPLFADIDYPAHAEALDDAEIYRLGKDDFFELLRVYPDLHLELTKTLARRLFYKAIMASELSSQEPEHRILRILDYLKTQIYKLEEPFSFKVELTRQQIADLTGLRVETVIRATKKLKQKGELRIKNRKLYR